MQRLSRLRQPSCRAISQHFNRTYHTALLRLIDIIQRGRFQFEIQHGICPFRCGLFF